VKAARGNRRELVDKVKVALQDKLEQCKIEATITGREKHLYSIYRKMQEKNLAFSEVFDIYGFRVVVRDQPSCYLALGALHALYKPIPGKFKDYIAIPKANGYQSLHTTLIGPYGTPVEIQIRTAEMNHVAESGVASHWLYKDDHPLTDVQKTTHKWLQSLLELQSASGDSTEFLEHVKVDLFPGEVYVFTPRGKILAMPRGATPVDFAYAVHTDIGNRCVACRINFESMPLRTELRNGDRVEIITAPLAAPNPNWLSYVRTARARAQIRHFLKNQQHAESTALGEQLLAQSLRAMNIDLRGVAGTVWDRFLRAVGVKSKQDVLADIGLGKRLPAIVARRLATDLDGKKPSDETTTRSPSTIMIHGNEGMAVQLAKCCRPIPGDPIIGVVRKGQGLIVHTHDCRMLSRSRRDRASWADVAWAPDIQRSFDVNIRIVANNEPGVLAKISAAIAGEDSNIVNVSMDDDGGGTTSLYFTLQVGDRIHLARILRSLRRIPQVVRIARLKD
jgi:guanosine-3',5'-bis(diphosphate) 3'-pyrophosphohydrolase